VKGNYKKTNFEKKKVYLSCSHRIAKLVEVTLM